MLAALHQLQARAPQATIDGALTGAVLRTAAQQTADGAAICLAALLTLSEAPSAAARLAALDALRRKLPEASGAAACRAAAALARADAALPPKALLAVAAAAARALPGLPPTQVATLSHIPTQRYDHKARM